MHSWHKWFPVFTSVSQFSLSVVSDSLRPHEPQHTRPPCPSPTPSLHPDPCPLSQWRHLTISFSAASFSFCLQSFPATGSFPVSWLFPSGGQSMSFSISHSNDYSGLISFGLIGLISFQSRGLSGVFSSTKVRKHQFFGAQPSLWSIPHICTWLLEKP